MADENLAGGEGAEHEGWTAVVGELLGAARGAGRQLASWARSSGAADLPFMEDLIQAAEGVDPEEEFFRLTRRLGVDWDGSCDELRDFARSRLTGEYAVDEFGFDPEFTERIVMPLLRVVAEKWFRIEVRGVENLPAEGPALLVGNHAGALPWDALILHAMVHRDTGRHIRLLGAGLVFETPYVHDFSRRIGATVACREDADALLEAGELVSVFPEGFKGLGKPYVERYRLQRFGRGGFVSTAVRAGAPIIPVAIVGSEEIYPLISGAPTLARMLGLPYFPVTPFFPWFGMLGAIPLPVKWIIEIGEPIVTADLPEGTADDPMAVFRTTDRVRLGIQNRLYALLEERRHPFWG